MRRARHLLTGPVSLVALLAALTFTAGTAHAESNGGVKVMPLGDSITDGLTVPGGYRIDLWQKFTTAGYQEVFVATIIPLSFDEQLVRTYNAAIPSIVSAA